MSRALQIACPPKVNLYLRIVRKREDGFHELETVFQSVDGGDVLTAEPAERFSLECDQLDLSTGDDNLVVRAARLLQREAAREDLGAKLHLAKRVPMGAGMGGGSVDAAATLVMLNEMWGLNVPASRLAELAAELGSDVPFFLHGGTALGGGRGERLEALPTPPLWLVLVRPDVAVNTGWAYGRWRAEACGGPTGAEFGRALAGGDPASIACFLRNDLEPGVIAEVPQIAAARNWLLESGALGARMTGSGSVVFGVALNREHAREVSGRPGAPGLVWTARCLSREEARLRTLPSRNSERPE
jgi:4-diphosphocytidyl-2-C-methyl-D-erythritol kinase